MSPLRPDLGELITVTGPDGSVAKVATHGAHVVSWKTADGVERLFVSSRATIANGAAIRGGIPVCFPQFADLGPLPKHGFARTSTWVHEGAGTFTLSASVDSWPGWPHACELTLEVLLGPEVLTLRLTVENTGDSAFEFTGALHTYLACDDVTEMAVSGLEGRVTRAGARIGRSITFNGLDDVDLAILAAQRPARLRKVGPVSPVGLICAQTGFPDVVVWNIGEQLAPTMKDLGAGEWKNYVCIEAGVVGIPVTLAARSRWTGSQTLMTDASSA